MVGTKPFKSVFVVGARAGAPIGIYKSVFSAIQDICMGHHMGTNLRWVLNLHLISEGNGQRGDPVKISLGGLMEEKNFQIIQDMGDQIAKPDRRAPSIRDLYLSVWLAPENDDEQYDYVHIFDRTVKKEN